MVTRGWRGRGNEELLLSGYSVSVRNDEKALEQSGDDGCTII